MRGRAVALGWPHSLHTAYRDMDALDADAFSQPGAKPPGRGRIARRDVGGARDAVGGTESAPEHVVDVEHRHHAPGFIGIDPPGIGEAGAMPHLHVSAGGPDPLWLPGRDTR